MTKTVFACLLACAISCVVSCSKENSSDVKLKAETSVDEVIGKPKVYLIKKGAHYCKPDPLVFTSKKILNFTAVFDSSCIYTTQDPKNQNDINKLYGFSDCGGHHLENSARVGWRWSNDSLRLFGFVHYQGEMLMQEITTAEIGSTITCSIVCQPTNYIFTVNGIAISMPRGCSGSYTRYKLNPYFGGDEVAPHDVRITITETK